MDVNHANSGSGSSGAASGAELLPPVFCDVSQEPRFGDIVANVPALTRKNNIWSLQHSRCLLPEEAMEAMGIPSLLPEQTLGLAAPWSSTKASLPSWKIKELVGNSMQLAAISAVIIYVLASTRKIEIE